MTTLTRLPADRYPWTWALHITTPDSALFNAAIAAIKQEIPPRARKWDEPGRRWLFREPETIASILDHIGLPYTVEEPGHRAGTLTRLQAARTLYLQPDAPRWVIDAVYRAAIKRYHPDTGKGDQEQMAAINVAVALLRAGQ